MLQHRRSLKTLYLIKETRHKDHVLYNFTYVKHPDKENSIETGSRSMIVRARGGNGQ